MGKSVILYEDEPLLRKHLENVFYTIRDEFHFLDSFPDADDVLNHLLEYKPDFIIMDIRMKNDDDGLLALFKIKNHDAKTKVMMLTTFDDDDNVFNAICLGADGYMLKTDFSSYQFPQEAIRKSLMLISNGGAYLTPTVAKKILNFLSSGSIVEMVSHAKASFGALFNNEADANKLSSRLTRMQKIVLQKIAEGKSTAEIAKELGLTENTINTHIKAVYNLLEVNSRTKAVKKAIEFRLIRTGD